MNVRSEQREKFRCRKTQERFVLGALSVLLSMMVLACESDLTIDEPQFGESTLIKNPLPVSASVKKRISGIYTVQAGQVDFGKQVVLHWDGEFLSIFCEKNVAYMVLHYSRLDSSIVFEGYWRFAQSDRTGLVYFRISPDEGGSELLQSANQPAKIILRGSVGENNDKPSKPVVLSFVRNYKTQADDFLIVGHRGGGRNSDRLPFSENSLAMLLFAGKIGANGVEIDIRLTKDGVPILFHDESFSTRLVNSDYMVGPVSNYKFDQIRTYARLINGEIIPTLEEALETILNKTTIRFVWLDVKSTDAVPKIVAIQKKILAQAAQQNRKLDIVFGIPDEDILNAYLSQPDRNEIPSLCELSTDDVRRTNALFWGPRWTLGTVRGDVDRLHGEGRKVIVWTLDLPQFITEYLRDGDFDGILTNYPTLVAYHHYIRE